MAEDRRSNGPSWAAIGLAFLAVLSALLAQTLVGAGDYSTGRALSGTFIWCKWRREPYLPYVDACAVGLAPAWFFGRLGHSRGR